MRKLWMKVMKILMNDEEVMDESDENSDDESEETSDNSDTDDMNVLE